MNLSRARLRAGFTEESSAPHSNRSSTSPDRRSDLAAVQINPYSRRHGHEPPQTPQRAAGFTLIELLVTHGVASVLLAIAAPSFRDMSIRKALAGYSNDMIAAVNYARSEAIRTRPAGLDLQQRRPGQLLGRLERRLDRVS